MLIDPLQLADLHLNLDVHGCQFSYQVSEDIRHRDDVYLPLVFTQLAVPHRGGVAKGGVCGCGLLQYW